MDQLFVVVTGLPASGKTTLAKQLAEALGLPLLDKDVFLEELFETAGEVDVPTRQRLSRESDGALARAALGANGAVIVSFWRHPRAHDQGGTPTDWLGGLKGPVVEVHCVCPPSIAEQRFRARQRHAGHNDAARSQNLAAQMDGLSRLGVFGLWPSICVRTDAPIALSGVVQAIRNHDGRP